MSTTISLPVDLRPELEHHPDDGVTRHTYFEPREEVMRELVEDLFVNNWKRIVVGPCIEGAVFEACFTEKPKFTFTTAI